MTIAKAISDVQADLIGGVDYREALEGAAEAWGLNLEVLEKHAARAFPDPERARTLLAAQAAGIVRSTARVADRRRKEMAAVSDFFRTYAAPGGRAPIPARLFEVARELIANGTPYLNEETGEEVRGVAISALIDGLRDKRWRNISDLRESDFEDAGFRVLRSAASPNSGERGAWVADLGYQRRALSRWTAVIAAPRA